MLGLYHTRVACDLFGIRVNDATARALGRLASMAMGARALAATNTFSHRAFYCGRSDLEKALSAHGVGELLPDTSRNAPL